ncbi:MAG: HPr(Ser) kinase/phosphatase [Bacillota bacterium]
MSGKIPRVSLEEIIEVFDLDILAPVNIEDRFIKVSDLKRPGLELAGYWKHFVPERIHILGMTEMSFLQGLKNGLLEKRIRIFMEHDPRAVIITRGIKPMDILLEQARNFGVPVLQSKISTTRFISQLTRFMENRLAPVKSVHGVLVDVYGLGLYIKGKSGIGKSETAIELIKRGHRLVADDIIEIKAISERELVGSAPQATKHFLEMRGIGIINVKRLFGTGAVKESTNIDLLVHLDNWQEDKRYERLGLDQNYAELLGIEIPQITIPVKPGRNIALVMEVVAMNHRLNKMGYNAAEDLMDKIDNSR